MRALRAPTLAQTRRAYYWWEAGAPRACVGVTRTFDVYPPLIVPWEKEGFLRHRSSCSALRVDRARAGGVRARGETREGRGAMRDILRRNLISPKPRRIVAVVAFVATPLPRRVASSLPLPHPARVRKLVMPMCRRCVTSFVAWIRSHLERW